MFFCAIITLISRPRQKFAKGILNMSTNKRIMVVDDETITIKTCEFILQKNDYEVVSANSGQKCLDYLRNPENPKVDLVLLDIEMPMLNGYNTLSSIRKSESLKDIPVIFLTATATPETVREAVRLGVNSYLRKPFLPQDLIDRVEDVLKKQKRF